MSLHKSAVVALFVVQALLTSGCASTPGWSDDVIVGLHRLVSRVRLIELGQESVPLTPAEAAAVTDERSDRDCMALKVNFEFGRSLTTEQMDEALAYARSPNDPSVRWLLARSLVDVGRIDDAAELLVIDLQLRSENASQRLWKWWQVGFGGRSDFAALSQNFTDALLRQFVAGTPEAKLAVARIFDKGEAEAALALEPFKQAIGYGQAVPKKQ